VMTSSISSSRISSPNSNFLYLVEYYLWTTKVATASTTLSSFTTPSCY
jgi:hypothetical protein